MRYILSIALLLLSTSALTHAQSSQSDVPQTTQSALPPHTEIADVDTSSTASWPSSTASFSQNVDVVTVAEPTHRHSCHVRAVDADSITCRSNLHHRVTLYHRDQVIALLDPPNYTDRWTTIRFFAIAGAALAASFFIPLAASVVLRVASGWVFFATPWMLSGGDHSGDLILYQRPNTLLTIKLAH